MKYEQYKLLSTELKEEYMFKFGRRPILMIQGLFNTIIIFCLCFILLVITYSMSVNNVAFLEVKTQLEIIFKNLVQLMRTISYVFIFYAIWIIIEFLSFYIGEYLWLRKNMRREKCQSSLQQKKDMK
jgi:hypothetical protein